MIRQDYIIRIIQEMVHALARALFLKRKEEYAQAVAEIDRALDKLRQTAPEGSPAETLDDWIALCRKEEESAVDKMTALADLFQERAELCEIQGHTIEMQRSRAMALGLVLEILTQPSAVVSVETLSKAEYLIYRGRETGLPSEVLSRLVPYLEARGKFGAAEDVLFEWLDLGDPRAASAGEQFYERLEGRTDAELAEGALPREEVREGREEYLRLAGGLATKEPDSVKPPDPE